MIVSQVLTNTKRNTDMIDLRILFIIVRFNNIYNKNIYFLRNSYRYNV